MIKIEVYAIKVTATVITSIRMWRIPRVRCCRVTEEFFTRDKDEALRKMRDKHGYDLEDVVFEDVVYR